MPEARASATASLALVGARGHVGAELIRLVAQHPALSLALATSRSMAGRPVAEVVDGAPEGLLFGDSSPEDVASSGADVYVLAMPDGAAGPFAEAIERTRGEDAVVLDLGSEFRFDDAWTYGIPELHEQRLRGARRIANPGCYATAMQLLLHPILDLIEDEPVCFGVSGYSGAGTTPSPRNDPENLRDGVLPYALVNHKHEREVSRHLGRPVRFLPHVAPFFRGICMTASCRLREPATAGAIEDRFEYAYRGCAMVDVRRGETPLVREIAGRPGAAVGGVEVHPDGRAMAAVCVLDNLLKGAASQAVQNINLALGFEVNTGLTP